MSEGFFVLPRSFTRDPLWIDCRLNYQRVFLTLLEHACYLPQKFDDWGVIIDLQPGQFCGSRSEIKKICGKHIKLSDVERSLEFFEKCQFLRQEVRHRKTIITFIDSRICECCFNTSALRSESIVRQSCVNRALEKNKDNKETKKQRASGAVAPALSQKSFFKEWVDLTQDEYDKLKAMYEPDKFEWMLEKLNNHLARNQKREKSCYLCLMPHGWVHTAWEEYCSKRKSVPGKTVDDAKNKALAQSAYEKYSSIHYRIEISLDCIEFIPNSGMQPPDYLKFNETAYEQQLENLLRKRGFSMNASNLALNEDKIAYL